MPILDPRCAPNQCHALLPPQPIPHQPLTNCSLTAQGELFAAKPNSTTLSAVIPYKNRLENNSSEVSAKLWLQCHRPRDTLTVAFQMELAGERH